MHARLFSCWLKRLLAAGVLAVALSPLPASAHGGQDHGSPAAQPHANQPAPPAHGWSPLCPGDSGGVCCCGGAKAFPGGARIAIVNTGGSVVFAQPLVQAPPASPRDTPLPLPSLYLVLPRAPPFLS